MTEARETAQLLRPVLDELTSLVDGIEAGDLSRPTPCTELTVEQLRDHVVTWLTTFAQGYDAADGKAPDPASIALTDDPAQQISDAARTLVAAIDEGAAERALDLGGAGAMPGAMALSMILWEYQVHGWDLARATEQPWSPAPAGLLAALEFAPTMLTPDFQGEGKTFAPQVPVSDDASELDRLVALSGRDPGWSASAS